LQNYLFQNLQLFTFYGVVSVILVFFFFRVFRNPLKTKLLSRVLFSFYLSLSVILISSEFWEIPIFAVQYVILHRYSLLQIMNHMNILAVAILLVYFCKPKFSKLSWLILILNLIINAALFPTNFPFKGYFLRVFTILCLSYVVADGVHRNG